LAGVLERGTAASARDLSPYVAGKTGTSEEENDTWFAGFTNDITVVVWVGYDNADGTRRTLGNGSTGASVALPIFRSIMHAAWMSGVPKVALAPPSAEAKRRIADLPIDLNSGERLRQGGRGAFVEHFRLDPRGALVEPKNRLVEHQDPDAKRQARDRRKLQTARPSAPVYNAAAQCFFFFCNSG